MLRWVTILFKFFYSYNRSHHLLPPWEEYMLLSGGSLVLNPREPTQAPASPVTVLTPKTMRGKSPEWEASMSGRSNSWKDDSICRCPCLCLKALPHDLWPSEAGAVHTQESTSPTAQRVHSPAYAQPSLGQFKVLDKNLVEPDFLHIIYSLMFDIKLLSSHCFVNIKWNWYTHALKLGEYLCHGLSFKPRPTVPLTDPD